MPPKENRALGVAVSRVVVFTNPLRFGPVVPPLLAVLLILGMAAALALVALSVGPSVAPLLAAAYGPVLIAALYLVFRRADDPGSRRTRCSASRVAALVAMCCAWRRTLPVAPWVRDSRAARWAMAARRSRY